MLLRHHNAAMAFGLCLLLACRSREPDGVALIGATLIDGSGGPPLPASAIVVRRGHIESVGSRANFQVPERTVGGRCHGPLDHARAGGCPRAPGRSPGRRRALVDAAVSRVGRHDRAGRARPAAQRAGAATGAESRLAAGAAGLFRGGDDRRRAVHLSRRDHRAESPRRRAAGSIAW